MASPCEVLIESSDSEIARAIFEQVSCEARRIEQKFSRYRNDNICYVINHSQGLPVKLDQETQQLLQFADQCYQASDGLFDITSGILRKVWRFHPEASFPNPEEIDALLPFIGWSKVKFSENHIQLPEGMEIDFGGIGKEYAVDRATQWIVKSFPDISVVINFGGDLRVSRPPRLRPFWSIGVDSALPTIANAVRLKVGAVCTSGNTERYLIHQGQRYGHILNPKTGYPVANAPRTVSVIAEHCTLAGMLATLAMLQGAHAEQFLQQQQLQYRCHW
jgi:thiamine biosynthesis lipoprotein